MSEGQQGPDRRDADGPVVGLTGARFGGATGRRLRQGAAQSEERAAEATASRSGQEQPATGDDSARRTPGTGGRRRRDPSESGRQATQPPVDLSPSPASDSGRSLDEAWRPVDEGDWDGPESTYGLVRPYSWTGGRTTPWGHLAMETMVSASGRTPDPRTTPEHHAVLQLCTTPRSVAEVAALLAVPLGVARVLLADMVDRGSVVVHRPAGSAGGAPDLALMKRVLIGLQQL